MNTKLRRFVKTSVATIAAALGLFGQVDSSAAKTSKQPSDTKVAQSSGWRITYYPGQVSAGSTVYLKDGAIKIDTDGSFEIVAKAPSWTATVSNKQLKRSCLLTSSQWMKNGFFLDPPDAKEYMNPKRADTTEQLNFRGLQSHRRTWETLESDAFYRHRSKPRRCTIELISADGINIQCCPMQYQLMSAWYGIPNLDGVPLFWQNVMQDERSLRLKVANVQRVTIAPGFFEPIKGTARELSMMRLVDNKYRTAVTDFLEMDAEPATKTSKPSCPADKSSLKGFRN